MTNKSRVLSIAAKAKRQKETHSQVLATLALAKKQGLMKGDKIARISARVSPVLVERAKKQTGIETDTELLEFALASIALEDAFPETMKKLEATIDPDIKLGY